mmetsp:Transcript_6230/g.14898  ORF Transcript_6230/g.14898 Transcript_6230/m.14898 type:complete len:461 (+) Transcript_6230:57-1439(+)
MTCPVAAAEEATKVVEEGALCETSQEVESVVEFFTGAQAPQDACHELCMTPAGRCEFYEIHTARPSLGEPAASLLPSPPAWPQDDSHQTQPSESTCEAQNEDEAQDASALDCSSAGDELKKVLTRRRTLLETSTPRNRAENVSASAMRATPLGIAFEDELSQDTLQDTDAQPGTTPSANVNRLRRHWEGALVHSLQAELEAARAQLNSSKHEVSALRKKLRAARVQHNEDVNQAIVLEKNVAEFVRHLTMQREQHWDDHMDGLVQEGPELSQGNSREADMGKEASAGRKPPQWRELELHTLRAEVEALRKTQRSCESLRTELLQLRSENKALHDAKDKAEQQFQEVKASAQRNFETELTEAQRMIYCLNERVASLQAENVSLGGHTNHKQKIQYLQAVREENTKLHAELERTRHRVKQLERGAQKTVDAGTPRSTPGDDVLYQPQRTPLRGQGVETVGGA